ncbi:MAG: hypothetical protein ACP5I4_09510 [Oceanipulchritudo sp.]
MKITTYSKTFDSNNILKVTAGTNVPQGGDTGHGGRTLLRLSNEGFTDWTIRIDGEEYPGPGEIELVLGGDCEGDSFAEALEFAGRVLRGQIGVPFEGVEESANEDVDFWNLT